MQVKFVAMAALAIGTLTATNARAGTILQYSFNGTPGTTANSATVTDASGTGNSGIKYFGNGGTYSSDIPDSSLINPGTASGTSSLSLSSSGILTAASGG